MVNKTLTFLTCGKLETFAGALFGDLYLDLFDALTFFGVGDFVAVFYFDCFGESFDSNCGNLLEDRVLIFVGVFAIMLNSK